MTIEYSLDEIERFDRTWTNAFAKRQGWQDCKLKDPADDLELFFSHLSGNKVLDIGCGWGRYVYRFLDHSLSYHGIDHSDEMLKIAKANNQGVEFLLGSFRSLPFANNTFDGLWCCCTLGAIPKKHLCEVLQEHQRVLKPGGIVHFIMPSPPESDEVLYTDDAGHPEIYQAHYHLCEFEDYVKRASLDLVTADERVLNGSFYVLAEKPR